MRPFPSSAPAAAGALLVLLAACAGPSASSPSPAPPPAPAATDGPARPGAPVITLLDAGATPRAPLRLRLVKGHRETLTMVNRSRQASAPWNGAPPLALTRQPTSRIVMSAEVADGGGARATMVMRVDDVAVVDEPDVDDQLEGATEPVLRTMIGMTTTSVTDDRGQVADLQVRYPDGMMPLMRQMIEGSQGLGDVGLQLPAEPVGVGARWRVDSEAAVGGLRVQRQVVVTLARAEGERVTLTVEVEMTAEPQQVASPMLQPGQTLELVELTGAGTGEIVMDRALVGPVSSHMLVTVRSKMHFRADGQEAMLGVTNESEVSASSTPAR